MVVVDVLEETVLHVVVHRSWVDKRLGVVDVLYHQVLVHRLVREHTLVVLEPSVLVFKQLMRIKHVQTVLIASVLGLKSLFLNYLLRQLSV